MQLILNGQIFKVIETPSIKNDEICFLIDQQETSIPEIISGDIILYNEIVWPNNKKEIFELYKTSVNNWLRYYVNDNRLYFTNKELIINKESEIYIESFELDDKKNELIKKSKILLEYFLETHPFKWIDGQYYNITKEKQNLLAEKISLYNAAKNLNVDYELTWNSSGDVNKIWSINDLVQLATDIQNYIAPLILYQQNYELTVKKIQTIDELNALKCNYYDIYSEQENEEKKQGIKISIA